MLFEDDCEILDPSFVDFVNNNKHNYDLMYIGTNRNLVKDSVIVGSWGTHAMWISARAIDCFLIHERKQKAIDNIWNDVEQQFKLKVYRPDPPNKYVVQKLGLKSLITGGIRIEQSLIVNL